jgi:hypothetical protein
MHQESCQVCNQNADEVSAERNSDFLRDIWQGVDGSTVITTNRHTRNSAIETVNKKGGHIGFGRLFILNVSYLFVPQCCSSD